MVVAEVAAEVVELGVAADAVLPDGVLEVDVVVVGAGVEAAGADVPVLSSEDKKPSMD